jgi:hypothetical protein
MDEKHSRIIKIATEIVKKDLLKGHLKWQVAEIARTCKIYRTQIYELLGKNKNEILHNSLIVLLEEIYGLSLERIKNRDSESTATGIIQSRKIVMEAPELLSFYFRHRAVDGLLGDTIRLYEKRYLSLVQQQTGIHDPKLLLYVRTIIHGISVAPYLTETEVSDCLDLLFKTLKNQ